MALNYIDKSLFMGAERFRLLRADPVLDREVVVHGRAHGVTPETVMMSAAKWSASNGSSVLLEIRYLLDSRAHRDEFVAALDDMNGAVSVFTMIDCAQAFGAAPYSRKVIEHLPAQAQTKTEQPVNHVSHVYRHGRSVYVEVVHQNAAIETWVFSTSKSTERAIALCEQVKNIDHATIAAKHSFALDQLVASLKLTDADLKWAVVDGRGPGEPGSHLFESAKHRAVGVQRIGPNVIRVHTRIRSKLGLAMQLDYIGANAGVDIDAIIARCLKLPDSTRAAFDEIFADYELVHQGDVSLVPTAPFPAPPESGRWTLASLSGRMVSDSVKNILEVRLDLRSPGSSWSFATFIGDDPDGFRMALLPYATAGHPIIEHARLQTLAAAHGMRPRQKSTPVKTPLAPLKINATFNPIASFGDTHNSWAKGIIASGEMNNVAAGPTYDMLPMPKPKKTKVAHVTEEEERALQAMRKGAKVVSGPVRVVPVMEAGERMIDLGDDD